MMRIMKLALLLLAAGMVRPGLVTPAAAQANGLTREQGEAQAAYDKALRDFTAVLVERRAQIDSRRERPGQALYLARLAVMSTYKDLTDVMPSRIGRDNKLGIPPAYLD